VVWEGGGVIKDGKAREFKLRDSKASGSGGEVGYARRKKTCSSIKMRDRGVRWRSINKFVTQGTHTAVATYQSRGESREATIQTKNQGNIAKAAGRNK